MKLLAFILPIGVYLLVEYWGGVWMALGMSMLVILCQNIYSLVKGEGWKTSTLADLAILVVFVGIEVLPYKWLGWLVMGVLLLLSATRIIDFFKLAGGQNFVDVSSPFMQYSVRKSQLRMGIWCIVSVLVYFGSEVVWPGTELSTWVDEWWLLTVLLAYVATEIVCGWIVRHRYKNVEWVPLMTEEGKVVGTSPRPLVHNGSMWLHPVVHLHVMHDGKILLQLRPKSKKIQPGKWDTAVGGHIAAGEKLEDALKREVWEEIGLSCFDAKLVKRYVWKCPVEHEFVFSFVTDAEGPFATKNVGEVDELKFWSCDELSENIGKDIFTPNLEHELTDWILPMMKG